MRMKVSGRIIYHLWVVRKLKEYQVAAKASYNYNDLVPFRLFPTVTDFLEIIAKISTGNWCRKRHLLVCKFSWVIFANALVSIKLIQQTSFVILCLKSSNPGVSKWNFSFITQNRKPIWWRFLVKLYFLVYSIGKKGIWIIGWKSVSVNRGSCIWPALKVILPKIPYYSLVKTTSQLNYYYTNSLFTT